MGVTTPPVADGAHHVYHQYTVRITDDRDGFAAALREQYAVGSGMFYPIPNHRLPTFKTDDDLPETERAARECLSLPVHPSHHRRGPRADRRRRERTRKGGCLTWRNSVPVSLAPA